MQNKYIVKFQHPETKEDIYEVLETETTRQSKVLKQINSAMLGKYGISIEDIEIQVFKYKR